MKIDIIVIGGGPAGSSAALVLGRSRLNVLLIDKATPRNIRSPGVHAYLTRNGIKPLDLRKKAHQEVLQVGVKILYGEVVDLKCGKDGFTVKVNDGSVHFAMRVVVATGLKDTLPDIDGMDRLYGRSVFHCPFCDGWEVRDKRLAVIADPTKGPNMAKGLLTWSSEVTLFTNGASLPKATKEELADAGITFLQQRIARLIGKKQLEAIELMSGERIPMDAVFFDPKPRQQSSLAISLGCETSRSGAVGTDKRQRTRIPDLYVAGDAAADPNMVAIASADGVKAALNIVQEMQREGHWIELNRKKAGR